MTKQQINQALGAFVSMDNIQKNQVVMKHENGTAFYSYGTFIGARTDGKLYLTSDHEYSKTTSKYATEWTGYTTKERREGLESGMFIQIVED